MLKCIGLFSTCDLILLCRGRGCMGRGQNWTSMLFHSIVEHPQRYPLHPSAKLTFHSEPALSVHSAAAPVRGKLPPPRSPETVRGPRADREGPAGAPPVALPPVTAAETSTTSPRSTRLPHPRASNDIGAGSQPLPSAYPLPQPPVREAESAQIASNRGSPYLFSQERIGPSTHNCILECLEREGSICSFHAGTLFSSFVGARSDHPCHRGTMSFYVPLNIFHFGCISRLS